MEPSDGGKVWYVTHAGEQYGPVSVDDVKFEAERGELNPRLDMVWKEGMEDWIPAGQVEGLFEKNAEAEAAEKAKEKPHVAAPLPEDGKHAARSDERVEQEKREGTSRIGFIFFCYIFPVIWFVGLALGADFLEGQVDPGILGPVTVALLFLPIIIAIAATLQRFRNLAMTRVWFLGLIVPFLNYWLGYRLFACPPGYAEHKKLDGIGWVLAAVYWLPLIVLILAVVFAAVVLNNSGPDDPYRLAIENYLERLKEFKTTK